MIGSLLRKTRRIAEDAMVWRQTFVNGPRSIHSVHGSTPEIDTDHKECEFCLSIVPSRASKCAFCGSTLEDHKTS